MPRDLATTVLGLVLWMEGTQVITSGVPEALSSLCRAFFTGIIFGKRGGFAFLEKSGYISDGFLSVNQHSFFLLKL